MTTTFITHDDCALHNMGPEHPESPIRLLAIRKVLERTGLIQQLETMQSIHVTPEQVALAHAALHQKRLEMKLPNEGIVYADEDTAMCPHSLHAASLAAPVSLHKRRGPLVLHQKLQCNSVGTSKIRQRLFHPKIHKSQ